MKRHESYSGSVAKYYDRIYSWKPYAAEARAIAKLIRQSSRSRGQDLLDVACGTGKHLQFLKGEFHCVGADLSPAMLALARRNNPDVSFIRADMTQMNLRRQFDAIVCLFSAIGYVKTGAALRKTAGNLYRHLRVGGVAIVEPWFGRSSFRSGIPHMTAYGDAKTKIARLDVSKIRGNLSVLEMHYLVARKNSEVKYYVDRHELGLFGCHEVLAAMKGAGFHARIVKGALRRPRGVPDRGLCVGIKL